MRLIKKRMQKHVFLFWKLKWIHVSVKFIQIYYTIFTFVMLLTNRNWLFLIIKSVRRYLGSHATSYFFWDSQTNWHKYEKQYLTETEKFFEKRFGITGDSPFIFLFYFILLYVDINVQNAIVISHSHVTIVHFGYDFALFQIIYNLTQLFFSFVQCIRRLTIVFKQG